MQKRDDGTLKEKSRLFSFPVVDSMNNLRHHFLKVLDSQSTCLMYIYLDDKHLT